MKNVPTDAQKELNQAITTIQENGELAAILKKYGY